MNKISQGLNSTNIHILETILWPETSQGEIIYKYRLISGMSQRDLAKKCNLHNILLKTTRIMLSEILKHLKLYMNI